MDGRTLTRHTDKLFFARATKSDLRGLGLKEMMGSGKLWGSEGVVDSLRAADVGKYITRV